MYELIQVSEHDFYIQSPAKIGLCLTGEGEAVLIDSGNDKDAGKKVKKHLEAAGLSLKAVYNTHSHADHIGGNKYLQDWSGCRIYCPGIDLAFTRHPVLEPALLYGGCPGKELRHKFLMAKESDAELLTEEALPEGFSLIDLPGHSLAMAGIRTPDDTVYLADCLSSRETLDKYGIGFVYDVGAYLETLEKIKGIRGKVFIPAHTEVFDSAEALGELADYNIAKVGEAADVIEGLCEGGTGFEDILKGVFGHYGLIMTFEQHALLGSTVRSYLSWMTDSGRLEAVIEEDRLLWKSS